MNSRSHSFPRIWADRHARDADLFLDQNRHLCCERSLAGLEHPDHLPGNTELVREFLLGQSCFLAVDAKRITR